MAERPVELLLKEKKIHEVINTRLVKAPQEITVRDAIKLMQDSKSGYVVIADNDSVVGIFTEVDVTRKILECDVDWNLPVSEFMTKNPFVLNPDDSVGKAIELMGTHNFYHIPLIDKKKKLTGVLSVRSLIRFLSEFYPTEVFNLPPKPDQIMETPEGG